MTIVSPYVCGVIYYVLTDNDFYGRDQWAVLPLTNSAAMFPRTGKRSSITIVPDFHLHSHRSFAVQEFYLLTNGPDREPPCAERIPQSANTSCTKL